MKFLMMALVVIGGHTVWATGEHLNLAGDQGSSCEQGEESRPSKPQESPGLTPNSTPSQISGVGSPNGSISQSPPLPVDGCLPDQILGECSSQCITPLRGVSLPPSIVEMVQTNPLKEPTDSTDCFEKSTDLTHLPTPKASEKNTPHHTSDRGASLNEDSSQSTPPAALEMVQTNFPKESTDSAPKASVMSPSLNEDVSIASSVQSKSDFMGTSSAPAGQKMISSLRLRPSYINPDITQHFSKTTYDLLVRGIIRTGAFEKVVQSKGEETLCLHYFQSIPTASLDDIKGLYDALRNHRVETIDEFVRNCNSANPTLRLTPEKGEELLKAVGKDLREIIKAEELLTAVGRRSSFYPQEAQLFRSIFSETTYNLLVLGVIRIGAFEKMVQGNEDRTPFLNRILDIPKASLDDIEKLSFDIGWRRVETINDFVRDCKLANPTLQLTPEKGEELLTAVGKDLREIIKAEELLTAIGRRFSGIANHR